LPARDAPQVLAVTGRLLLLEALAARDDSERSWERFARDLAAAHRSTAGTQFGWHRNGYLGRFRQVNTWTASGHQFFAEHRLLRYLSEPAVEQALTAADCRAIERLCDRLPEVIPAMPSVLTHGDLWAGNLVSQPGGRITVIDPPSRGPGPKSTCPCCGARRARRLGPVLRALPGTQPLPAQLDRPHAHPVPA
jgi:fructosamine-3-kinase